LHLAVTVEAAAVEPLQREAMELLQLVALVVMELHQVLQALL
jgi:hypothetical protein